MSFEILEASVLHWAKEREIIPGSSPETQLLKTMSELGELADALIKGGAEGVEDGIGDVLVTLIIVANLMGYSPVQCLQHAYTNIKNRRGSTGANGVFVKEE